MATKTKKAPQGVESKLIDERRIEINGQVYEYERLKLPPTRCCLACVRLYKGEVFTSDFDVRDVAILEDGRTDCTCEDFIYRSGPAGKECKHIVACRDRGLLAEVEHEIREAVIADQEHDAAWLAQQESMRWDAEYADGDFAHLEEAA